MRTWLALTSPVVARRWSFACVAALAAIGAGCVVRTEHTINAHITVDIRHIEKQADDVLDFEGKTDALPATAAQPKPTSQLDNFLRLIDPMPAAHAAELTTLSPLAEEILKRMQGRNGDIASTKATGCFGENNRGYLELRDCDGLKDNEARNHAQQLLAEDNKDRKALYNEIARLNKESNVSVSAVEAIYAQKRLMRAKSGEVYQLPPAGKDLDEFKNTAPGKALGAKAVASAWVTIP